MTEQVIPQSGGKKPGLLRRIFWWLWVILLSALLALGLFFAAPWKVITLIAIFLAAATILPRIYRKWFWLGVGIVIIALVIWIFLPDDNSGWRPYQFDKEKEQLQARFSVPDSENAALVYNKILADWKQKEANEPNLPEKWLGFVRNNYWQTKDQPEVAAYIQYHKNTIEQLIQAGKFQRCAFPIGTDIFYISNQTKNISAMRLWAYLFTASANNDVAEGKPNDALEKYLVILRMGHHFSQQPTTLDSIIGFGFEGLALTALNRFVVLNDINESCLNEIEQAVSTVKRDLSSDLPGFIASDKLMFKNMLGGIWFQVNAQGNTRFSRDPSAWVRELAEEHWANGIVKDTETKAALQQDIYPYYWARKLYKAKIILGWFYLPATPQELSKVVDAVYEKYYLMTKPDFNWPKPRNKFPFSFFQLKLNLRYISKMMAESNGNLYLNLHDIYLRNLSSQKGTLLLVALKRYKNANGKWPEKLDDINNISSAETFIDPLNGGSFVYKLTDDNFTLYSKGENGIDEEGKYEMNWPDKPSPDDWMIWPPRGSKKKDTPPRSTGGF